MHLLDLASLELVEESVQMAVRRGDTCSSTDRLVPPMLELARARLERDPVLSTLLWITRRLVNGQRQRAQFFLILILIFVFRVLELISFSVCLCYGGFDDNLIRLIGIHSFNFWHKLRCFIRI